MIIGPGQGEPEHPGAEQVRGPVQVYSEPAPLRGPGLLTAPHRLAKREEGPLLLCLVARSACAWLAAPCGVFC